MVNVFVSKTSESLAGSYDSQSVVITTLLPWSASGSLERPALSMAPFQGLRLDYAENPESCPPVKSTETKVSPPAVQLAVVAMPTTTCLLEAVSRQ